MKNTKLRLFVLDGYSRFLFQNINQNYNTSTFHYYINFVKGRNLQLPPTQENELNLQ